MKHCCLVESFDCWPSLVLWSLRNGMLATPSAAQPFIYPRDPKTFNWRDLKQELNNKMTGTYTVAAMGDVLWRMPIGQRISPQLRDVMRNADTTFGNIEGYIIDERNCIDPCAYNQSWMPKDAAKGYADLGFDFIAPGEFNGGLAGHLSTIKYLNEAGVKMAGAGPISRSRANRRSRNCRRGGWRWSTPVLAPICADLPPQTVRRTAVRRAPASILSA